VARRRVRSSAGGERARVHHQALQPEGIRAIVLFEQRGERLLPQCRRRRRDVDQVAVVRDHRMDAGVRHPAPEQDDLILRDHAGPPLTRGLGEDLQRLTAAGHRAIDRPRQSPAD
jgi:hypothetical protein